MSLEWKDVVLKDVLSEKGYIRGPFGSALKRAEMKSEGIPVYEQQNAIYNNRIFRYFIDEEKYQSLKRFTTYPDDLIISCSGTVGKVSIIKDNDPKGIISQALLTLRVNKDLILPEFLKYFFSSYEGYNSLVSRSTGSVQVNISKRAVIEQIPLKLPPLDIQQKIVYYLSLIDKKIETNEKINRNLEAIASNIFKNYFIDFEPFQELTLIDSNIGNIPKEWEFTKLEDIIDVKDGTHDSPSAIDDGFPLITSKHLNEYDVNKNEANRISFEDYTNINKRSLVEPFDILISMIGTVGNICYIMYDEVDFAIKNVGLFKTSQTPLIREYLLLYLKSSIINHYIDSRLAGSTQKYISLTELRNIPIVIPPNEVLKEFKNIVNPIFNNIKINHFEINNLIKLRDTLLPKLMSGEIDVSKINCDLE